MGRVSRLKLAVAIVATVFCSSPRRVRSFIVYHPSWISSVGPESSSHSSKTPRRVIPDSFYYGDGSSSFPSGQMTNVTDFASALAIVPPLPDWDRLQRARHYARDRLFHKWPPAIRLFHPFRSSALDVAQVIEELELEPFEITLDTWVIVPHLEAVEAAWMASRMTPQVEDKSMEWDVPDRQKEEDEKVRQLIEKEIQIAKEKAQSRARKTDKQSKSKNRNDDDEHSSSNATSTATIPSKEIPDNDDNRYEDMARTLEQQQQLFEDFGGPCILCLEPDAESKLALQELQEELALLLDHDTNYTSPSSIYSCKYIVEPAFQPDDYRPLIPIASFESSQGALDVARRLKGVWGDPLTFTVNDLHVISCRDDLEQDAQVASIHKEGASYFSSSSSFSLSDTWMVDEPWGCNAKIKLMGEEQFPANQGKDNEDLAWRIQKLMDTGEAGGNDISNDYTILEDEEEVSSSDIELWLDNDEDWDEGMEVVIGRTLFFTGDQRNYRGMPASSVVDSKDRSMGDIGGSSVSGLTRRRRATRRTGNYQWDDGEFGRRKTDYLPWTKRERAKKVNRLLDPPSAGINPQKNADDISSDDDNEDDF